MKKIKYLLTGFMLLTSLLLCFDGDFYPVLHTDARQMPVQSDSADLLHHHHLSITDQLFQKTAAARPVPEPITAAILFQPDPSAAESYLSFVWQPPKTT